MAGDTLPEPGDLIGVRYRIESTLGQGGMGAVFAAVNQATGRAVAIKWMLPGAARSQESLARFLAEARATAKIEHPNVIQILDVGQDGDCPFLVMERLRGRSLGERLQHGKLSVEETLSVMLPACRGVAEAHSEGILHRDLKPDNIFLCQGKDGSPRPPKVLDFGISKLYDEGGGQSLTRTGVAMGTPQYMSPEQISAASDADARLDVYAMGVVLYECLTGRPPYTADGLFALVQEIAAGTPVPIRHLSPDVPADLEAVVMRAMASQREHRHGTMRELIADLERIAERTQTGTPPSIPATSAVSSPHDPSTRPMGGPQSGGQTGPQFGQPPSGGLAVSPAEAPRRSKVGWLVLLGCGAFALLLGVLGLGGAGYFLLRPQAPDAPVGNGGPVVTPAGGQNTGPIAAPGGSRTPRVDLTFSGECDPSFAGRVMVTGASGVVSVTALAGSQLTGSLQLQLGEATGTLGISTEQRVAEGTVINVMAAQTIWTNMTLDYMAVRSGRIPDPVSGSLTITEFDPMLAKVDVTFHDVTLQNTQNGSLCTLDGRVQTFGTTYGM